MKKVLIIAGALHIGGAEKVAVNLSKYAPKEEFLFDYLVFEGYENVYGAEIEERGGRVFTLPSPSKGYLRYCRSLAELIRENGYSVVHSHTQFNSGLNLAVAKRCGVPIRIGHSHTTKTERKVSLPQKLYEAAMRVLLRRYSTHLLACGEEAGVWMFGKKAFSECGRVIKNGIDAAAFAYSPEVREAIRASADIPKDAFVIGHAGTLLPLKNQEFLIRLLPRIKERIPNAMLLLLGAGTVDEKSRLQCIADECGVSGSVLFGGGVGNVNEYLSAMDVFAFPSLREGTPLALLEAQANGLPCIISDRIPRDAALTDLVRPVRLEDEDEWIDLICTARRNNPCSYAEVMVRLGYDSAGAYKPVYDIYRSLATVSLSFDDGRGDNADVLDNLLLPLGVPATLNITTGYIDGTCPKECRPSKKSPLSVEDVRRFADNPLVEIAMHGDRHLNSEEDILRGEKKLREWLPESNGNKMGFASPGSGLSLKWFRSPEAERLRESILYMRTGIRVCTLSPLRRLIRKAGRVIHLATFYRFGYHDTVMTEADGQIVYSIPVMKDATVRQVAAAVKDAVRRRGAVVLMLHSVLDDVSGEDNWTWERKKLEELCRMLLKMEQEGKLCICTTAEQYRMLRERT